MLSVSYSYKLSESNLINPHKLICIAKDRSCIHVYASHNFESVLINVFRSFLLEIENENTEPEQCLIALKKICFVLSGKHTAL